MSVARGKRASDRLESNRGGKAGIARTGVIFDRRRRGGRQGWKSDGAVSPSGKKAKWRLNCKRRRSRRDRNGVQKEELGKTGVRRDELWPRDGKLVDWLGSRGGRGEGRGVKARLEIWER